MKKRIRFLIIFCIVFLIIFIPIFVLCPKYKKSVKCSNEIQQEVVLVAEFARITDYKNNVYSTGVMSFKIDDYLYGIGHDSSLEENEEYNVYKVKPIFIERTPDSLGTVDYNRLEGVKLLGEVVSNSEDGLIIHCNNFEEQDYRTVSIADEIFSGDAQIMMRDENGDLQTYSVSIQVVIERGEERLDVTITDEELLKKTSGIILGMSGSPIIQNDKLVGILSHAYVYNQNKGKAKIIWNVDFVKNYMENS